ncbi:2-polyprenyl-6-methoxyphenol hydroxylase-like FAD-dependent oxidoreductase [Crossiella equi]|uniref:2-polyprenyl-6-methoxyphenol hydroxylase-like FAD-dependent oxidoreductase n=1 Tax=Crossiella equi TaxID=130796 RepID=A0ABS5AG89_9PSEU|nr:FAD-dependent monooxygenase [Crossiella equi]MBP2475356.1 2-polyprenyl-6-methoxyphenol hydroxylase-like FAD-dependent oxidoreductase [Crossiella equi]
MRGSAVVVGGGLGGLTAAVALRHVGWEVVVLERAPEFGEVGAGVGVMPNAMRALDALGLGAAVRERGTPRVAGGIRDSRGRALSRLPAGRLEAAHGRPVAVHRADLHAVLRSALPSECLVNSAEVLEVTPGVRYRREGEHVTLRPDVVVAADGIRSRVRQRLWLDVPAPVYAGATAWRAVTGPDFPHLDEMTQVLGPGTEAGVLPLDRGRVYWYVATVCPPGGSAPDELAEVRRLVGHWAGPLPELVEATDPAVLLRHDIYELATPPGTFVHGNVALLGDAAHAMTPYLGQGACQAVEDGVTLAAALAGHPDVAAGLAEYDRQRVPRTRAVGKRSRLLGRLGHQVRNPVLVKLRDLTLRVMPARAGLRGLTAVMDWRPPELPAA